MKLRFWQHKRTLLLVLGLVLTLTTVKVAYVYSAESTVQEKGLAFIRDVIGIDLTKYDVKIGDAHQAGLGSQAVRYTLESSESKLSIVINLRQDNAFVSCSISSLKGSPLLVQPKTTALEGAKSVLEKYQTFAGASHPQELRNALDAFSLVKNGTKMIGDIKMETSVSEGEASKVEEGTWVTQTVKFETIQWMKTVNGITNNYAIVYLSFRNGILERFSDSWNMHKIGSSDVTIDREKAISLAIDAAKKYSWMAGDVTVSNVTIANQADAIRANLLMQPRADDLLYPEWQIYLGLDKVYPGGITEIRVDLQADTGKIDAVSRGGGYGIPSDSEQSSKPSPSEQPSSQSPSISTSSPSSENKTNGDPLTNTFMIGMIAATAAVAAIATVVFKKKRGK